MGCREEGSSEHAEGFAGRKIKGCSRDKRGCRRAEGGGKAKLHGARGAAAPSPTSPCGGAAGAPRPAPGPPNPIAAAAAAAAPPQPWPRDPPHNPRAPSGAGPVPAAGGRSPGRRPQPHGGGNGMGEPPPQPGDGHMLANLAPLGKWRGNKVVLGLGWCWG